MRRPVVDPRFGPLLRELREARDLSLRALAKRVYASSSAIHEYETGKTVPNVETVERLDTALGADGRLVTLVTPTTEAPTPLSGSWETTELLHRLRASDTAPATIEALHRTTFDLCCQYPWRQALELRAAAHGWLREVTRLLRQPVGLREHRELLVSAGWLALLAGCCEYDLGMRAGAEATRVAAGELGGEAGHGEIVAWSWEMSAWFALTQGRYRDVVDAAEAGQATIGEHAAAVQLIAQEAKALGRLGDKRGVRAALERGRQLLDRFPPPSRPEHHFVVDPDKWDFYAMDAYRLAGEDELAEHHAQQVLTLGTRPDGTELAPMRMAEARLTLGAVAARAGELEQSVETALDAFRADRRSLPSLLMVAREVEAELCQRYPRENAVAELRDVLRSVLPGRLPDGPGPDLGSAAPPGEVPSLGPVRRTRG